MLRKIMKFPMKFAGKANANFMKRAQKLTRKTLAQNGISTESNMPIKTLKNAQRLQGRVAAAMNDTFTKLQKGQGYSPDIPGKIVQKPGSQSSFSCKAGTRDYELFVPKKPAGELTGLVVMLHGCTQTPGDFAAGTRMNALADKFGFAVVYPAQSRGANAQTCWNWFSKGDQRRDRGEPAIIAGLTREIVRTHNIPEGRVFVCGLSAGGAMAIILARCYPELFTATGVHSGLPYGSATDIPTAFAVMGAGRSVDETATDTGPAVPTIVFHGAADAIVNPLNGQAIIRQLLSGSAKTHVQSSFMDTKNGRSYTREITSKPDGTPIAEYWVVAGLGHAWSGGAAAGSYTDAKGPDASAEMVRFFFESATA